MNAERRVTAADLEEGRRRLGEWAEGVDSRLRDKHRSGVRADLEALAAGPPTDDEVEEALSLLIAGAWFAACAPLHGFDRTRPT